MIWRVLTWCAVIVVTVAVSWLWPKIEKQPTDFDIAMRYLNDGEPKLALLFFEDKTWKGVAAYRAGRYAQATREFTAEDEADQTVANTYNLGNSHAVMGKFEEAIAAYNRVLRFNPEHADAIHNLEVVKKAARPPNENIGLDMESAPETQTKEGEKQEEIAPQENTPQSTQARESEQSDTAGNTSDTDDAGETDGSRPKPEKSTGETGSAGAVGLTADERDGSNKKVVGTVDLKARDSAHPAEILLRKIQDDPEKVLRARLLSAYENRIEGAGN